MRWSDTEVDLLLRLKKEGYGRREIAERLGRTLRAVDTKYRLLTAVPLPLPWEDKVVELYKDGMPVLEIAAKYGISRTAVHNILHKYDIQRRNTQWNERMDARLVALVDEGRGYAEIGRELGCNYQAVAHRVRKLGLCKRSAWTEEEITELRRGYAKGVSVAVIAERLGRTEQAVMDKAYKLGVRHGMDGESIKK